MPIGGGRGLPPPDRLEAWTRAKASATGVSVPRMADLVRRYGTRATDAARFIAAGPDAPLVAAPDHSKREMLWLIAREKVRDLSDLLLRRTSLGIEGRVDDALIVEAGALLGEALGLAAPAARASADRLRATMARRHRVLPS